MELKFVVLGYEVARIELDLGEEQDPQPVSPLDKGAKKVSNWFFRRMIR